MNEPIHITNLRRAQREAWERYEQAIDGDDPILTQALGDAAEILTDIFHHEYNDPLNWVEAVELPVITVAHSIEL